QQRQPLGPRLGDEQPVERVLMVVGKFEYFKAVCFFNGQPFDAVDGQLSLKYLRPIHGQLKLAQPGLDAYLPIAGRAEIEIVVGIEAKLIEPFAGRLFMDEPEKGMRIEQKSHSIYSANSSNGASKSSAMWRITPAAPPARR